MSDPFEEWKSARGKEPIPSSIPAGTVIGEYEVLGLIGRGGSAEVYSATHVKLGATVAIKILHKLTEQSRIRFDREAKILSGTTHPCFPQFKSYGEFEGRPYIVTELLGPCNLPRTDRDAARFLLKVLDGVGCLHRLGFVHRDIKPANILMRNGKEPVLTDFGLACPISPPRQIMGRISIVDGRPAGVGTPGYAAPEQFEGGEVSAATDVHAVGMLADECFDGKPPRCWRRIIDRATNSRKTARFATAKELAWAIRFRHARFFGLVLAVVALALLVVNGVLRGSVGGGSHPTEEKVAVVKVDSGAKTQKIIEQSPAPNELLEVFGMRFGATRKELPPWEDKLCFRRFKSPFSLQTTSLTGRLYAFHMVTADEQMRGMTLEDVAEECRESLKELQRLFSLGGSIINTVNPEMLYRQWKSDPYLETMMKGRHPWYGYRIEGRGCVFSVQGGVVGGQPRIAMFCQNNRFADLEKRESQEWRRQEKQRKLNDFIDKL